MEISDIKIPKTREECIELAKLAILELEKINKILDEVFAKCEQDLLARKASK